MTGRNDTGPMGDMRPYKVPDNYQNTLQGLKCYQVPIKVLAFEILYDKGFLKFKIAIRYNRNNNLLLL